MYCYAREVRNHERRQRRAMEGKADFTWWAVGEGPDWRGFGYALSGYKEVDGEKTYVEVKSYSLPAEPTQEEMDAAWHDKAIHEVMNAAYVDLLAEQDKEDQRREQAEVGKVEAEVAAIKQAQAEGARRMRLIEQAGGGG